jgi:hypothetical protein
MSREGDKPSDVEVDDADGRVVLRFGMPLKTAAFEPGVAVQIAESLVKAAKRCGWREPLIWLPKKS